MIVNTIYGEMDDSLLEKKEGTEENPNQTLNWVEYWKNGEMVHRSVHLILKQGLFGGGEAASIV